VATVSTTTALWRGIRRRCGRCGAKHVFRNYFQLRDRCPACGYRFVREEGAFTGVMLLNITVTFTLMFLSLISYVLWRGVTGDAIDFRPFAAACGVFAVLTPLVFYPIAASGWAAFDLVTRPLDEREEADARAFAAEGQQR
jgi:hypothetical protein